MEKGDRQCAMEDGDGRRAMEDSRIIGIPAGAMFRPKAKHADRRFAPERMHRRLRRRSMAPMTPRPTPRRNLRQDLTRIV